MVGDTPLGLRAELKGKTTSYNGRCTDWPTSVAILLESLQFSCKQSNPSDKLHLQDRLTEQLQTGEETLTTEEVVSVQDDVC
jgi:hypothetical protein